MLYLVINLLLNAEKTRLLDLTEPGIIIYILY